MPAKNKPGIVKSKKPILGIPLCSAIVAAIRFALEPIRVVIPPRIHMKLSGISDRDGFIPIFAATAVIIGMKITTTGVLFMKAETNPAMM